MLRRSRCVLIFLQMVSPRHYTVDPMLSASGTLFKCHEEFFFFTCCIGIPIEYILFVPQLPRLERGLKGGGDSSLFIFWKKKQKTKKNILGRNRTQGFNLLAKCSRVSRGDSFTCQVSIPMESEPWLACACKISRRPRSSGEKASADLKKLQQIFMMVQLASNLRDNRSRMSKFKYSRAPRSGTCVPNLGPTSPTPLPSRSQRSKHR